MAAQRLRPFLGITELSSEKTDVILTNDQIVNSIILSVEGNSNITTGSTIDVKKTDGSTTFISGKVDEIKRFDFWSITALSNGYELNTTPVQQVYLATSPEDIVQDVIDNFTVNLTFASTDVSGFTISKYIADGYAIDILKDMMTLLDWQIRIDLNDNVYFEPQGSVNNGYILTEGSNFTITSHDEDKKQMINHVKVKGGFEGRTEKETLTGVGTTFRLKHKPSGAFIAFVNLGGAILDPSVYTVDPESESVTFDASQTNPYVEYSWNRPIIVEYTDDDSINTYEQTYFQEIEAPFFNTFSDTRKYAQEIVSKFSDPLDKAKGFEPFLNFDRVAGETVSVFSAIRGIDEDFVISKISFIGREGITMYELGEREFDRLDWEAKVQKRIKDLEKRFINDDDVVFAKTLKNTMTVDLTINQIFEFDNVQNSFYLSHKTLSRLLTPVNGSKYNFEADCSDNNNDGTWQGTGIAGSQYNQSGFRLGAADFNGSNNYVTTNDAANLDGNSAMSWAFAINTADVTTQQGIISKWVTAGSNRSFLVYIEGGEVKLQVSSDGINSEVQSTTGTAISTGSWIHIVVTYDAGTFAVYINGVSQAVDGNFTSQLSIANKTAALEAGRRIQANYYTGEIDEVRVYNVALTSAEALALKTKFHVNRNMVLYWAFDNPRLGPNFTARATVT